MSYDEHRGFTLIELLIVVAIIAVLAAIALPNFLEAQTRSRISRAKADMRSAATAVEAYAVDNNAYPMIVAVNSAFALTGSGPANGPSVFYAGVSQAVSSRFIALTTPVAYMASVPRDPFISESVRFAYNPSVIGDLVPLNTFDTYGYLDARSMAAGGIVGETRGAAVTSGAQWHLVCSGPDRIYAHGGGATDNGLLIRLRGVDHDPTNGTISTGDIVRVGGGEGPLNPGGPLPAYDRVRNKYN